MFPTSFAMTRPKTSVVPPAANGTTIVTGRLGQTCGPALATEARTAATAAPMAILSMTGSPLASPHLGPTGEERPGAALEGGMQAGGNYAEIRMGPSVLARRCKQLASAFSGSRDILWTCGEARSARAI